MTRCARFVCSPRRFPNPCSKATTPISNRRSRSRKPAEDQALVDGVEYVDTSAYEQYEKQEGDFVEGAVLRRPRKLPPLAEAPAEATVPPDEPFSLNNSR